LWNKISRVLPKRSTGLHSASNPIGLEYFSLMGFGIGVVEIWSSVIRDVAIDGNLAQVGNTKRHTERLMWEIL
jgi:hypothetical protein